MRRSDLRTKSSRWITRHWRTAPLALLARGADRYLRAYNNKNHAHKHNGEGRVLGLLAAEPPGDDRCRCQHRRLDRTRTASTPTVAIYAFEPSPLVAADLHRRFQSDQRATIVPAALGARPELANLHVNERISSVTSFVPSPDNPTTPVDVVVHRGDDYLKEAGIGHLDYLKVDVEGFELEVLQGFSEALAGQAITALQFEYNEWSLLNRRLSRRLL